MSICFEHVTFSYDKTLVCDDFSLRLPEKGVVCFMGESGCGKTTLLRLLLGLETPKAGRITGCVGLRFSVVFQEDRLLPWLTLADNLRVALKGPKAEERLQQALSLVGLNEEQNRYPDELSGGMKRRAAIARAMAFHGDVLILDEPFNGIDEARWQRLSEIICRQYQERLILLVTHVRSEWEAFHAQVYSFKGHPLCGVW